MEEFFCMILRWNKNETIQKAYDIYSMNKINILVSL